MNRFVKLKDICLRITDGSHYSPKAADIGFPMLSVKDMRYSDFDYKNCKFISKKDYLSLVNMDCKPLKNDIVIAKDGSYLKHVFVIKEEKEQAILSSIGILRPNLEKINPFYLKYYLHTSSVKEIVAKKYVSGSALPRIILKNFGEIDILYKKLITQQRIASVLSSLDGKIELNNRINAELEAIAKTLYDYWFVQFDFPDADGKPYKSSGGKMVYNEELKREIPEGWEVKTLSDIIDVKDGTHDSPKPQNAGYPLVTSKCLKPEGIDYSLSNLISEKDYIQVNKRSKVDQGDVLFSMIGNIGTIYKVEESIINFAIKNVALFKTSEARHLKNYLYLYLHSFDMKRHMSNVISGSIQKFIGLGALRNIPFLFNLDIIMSFNKISQEIFNKKEILKRENQHIASLRDWLLPMLMNGQVGFKEAYQVQEQTVNVAAEAKVEYKPTPKNDNFQVGLKEEKTPIINLSQQQDQRFELWLSSQGLAARGEIDKTTLREIFNVMDEEEYGK